MSQSMNQLQDLVLDDIQSRYREPSGTPGVVLMLRAKQNRAKTLSPDTSSQFSDRWAERAWMIRMGEENFHVDD